MAYDYALKSGRCRVTVVHKANGLKAHTSLILAAARIVPFLRGSLDANGDWFYDTGGMT